MAICPTKNPVTMQSTPVLSPGRFGAPTAILAIALLAVLIGGFFRFYHLDRKVWWGDEVYTSLRILGETEADEVKHAVSIHDAHDLYAILHPVASEGEPDPLSPVRSLALEEPHHSPIYYEAAHFWVGAAGNSIAATRIFSALISLLALPCAFWLGIELYGSRRAGWIAVALVALSPFQIVYAQEAREYALWGVALLALSAALLRAIRLNRPADWVLVAALTVFSLYVSALTFLVLAGFAGYVLVTQWGKRRLLVACGLAFAFGAIAYIPWLYELYRHLHTVVDSLATTFGGPASKSATFRAFVGLLRLNLFDVDLIRSSSFGIVATGLAALAIAVTIAFVVRHEPARVWLFLALPILTTALALVVPDLFSGQRVHNPRYFMPVFLYLDFFFVGLFASNVWRSSRRGVALSYVLLIALLSARTASAAASSQALTWWNKMEDNSIYVADAVNRSERPLIVSDAYLDYALALGNYLRPDVAVAVRPPCYMCSDRSKPILDATVLPAGHYTDLYALGPSPRLQQLLKALIAQRDPNIVYHCINIRHNCDSDLNVEPVFGPSVRPPAH